MIDNDKKEMVRVDVIKIKLNTGCVSLLRTRNSTRKNHILSITNKQFRRNLFLSFIVPSTNASFAICIASKFLCALSSSVHMLRFLQNLLK